MNPGIDARLKQSAKVLASLCAIEMVLPSGTLIVLGDLLTGQPQGRWRRCPSNQHGELPARKGVGPCGR